MTIYLTDYPFSVKVKLFGYILFTTDLNSFASDAENGSEMDIIRFR